QGEDVVSGRRTPLPLTSAQVRRGMRDESLEASLPATFSELREFCERLEERFGDAVDVELTVEDGRLYVLQCRPAKRTARAAARIAVEMQVEGTLDRSEALARVGPASLRQRLTPRLPDPQALAAGGVTPIARGLAASPGAAVGRVALDANAAAALGAGEEIILVRAETSAEDVETMRAVAGVLTAAGGLTSHAAVVARAMGKPCVAGATSLHVDDARRRARLARGRRRPRHGEALRGRCDVAPRRLRAPTGDRALGDGVDRAPRRRHDHDRRRAGAGVRDGGGGGARARVAARRDAAR